MSMEGLIVILRNAKKGVSKDNKDFYKQMARMLQKHVKDTEELITDLKALENITKDDKLKGEFRLEIMKKNSEIQIYQNALEICSQIK